MQIELSEFTIWRLWRKYGRLNPRTLCIPDGGRIVLNIPDNPASKMVQSGVSFEEALHQLMNAVEQEHGVNGALHPSA